MLIHPGVEKLKIPRETKCIGDVWRVTDIKTTRAQLKGPSHFRVQFGTVKTTGIWKLTGPSSPLTSSTVRRWL